ncbi:3-deoxy-D-manno-octulosonic acid transferase [Dyadobacter luticola]|uniref:3-deoxy-D-manno-octulosonic acid transferase n=1 Tax=Dyadobacter luticola TaxID=1979387 RepID=A0A5R9KRL0_9BACT|nr:glycosyltransferase N-terminal domain-containing protein [Dyadobacter luticola]TLU98769.1 3-deoxy-D-manno-octulosonic acid transferase [Dyadobacter luticola]
MIEFVYQIAISLFASLIKFVAPFNAKIKQTVDGRKGLIEELERSFPALAAGRPVAWFHAASLGEFEQGRPVIEAYKNQYPEHFILVTFFSPSGYEVRKNYNGADYICYLPFDTASNARRFVAAVQPSTAFFIKYEFWNNYLRELKKNGSHILSFSSIFREEQIFFKSYGGFFRDMLRYFDHIFVQNEKSVALLKGVGIKATVAGDTRFDRVKSIAANARDLPVIAGFRREKLCLIAGSVWEEDMQVLFPVLNGFQGKFKAIIAPHEIKKEQIRGWREKLKGIVILFSEIGERNIENADYLIIDNVGMLSSLYKYGDMAYIGGSFGVGLHNILEAATFGLPVLFGNKSYHRFQEAIDLISLGGAFPVADAAATSAIIEKWLQNAVARTDAGNVSREYVETGTGATEMIMRKVQELAD